MSNSLIVKDAIGNTLKRLTCEQPLSKISVKDITNACNISRNTFYYHFSDKYELIYWMFERDMLENVNCFNDPTKLFESFSNVCKCLFKNKKFYLACFRYVGQNSLYEYILDYYCELFKINLTMQYTEVGLTLTETELYLMARMEAHALVGIISDWVKGGMQDNYMKYFDQIIEVQKSGLMGFSVMNERKQHQTQVDNQVIYLEKKEA